MSSLLKIVKPTETVSLGDSEGQSFTVTGLTPNHIFGLYHRHRGQLAAMFDKVVGEGGSVDLDNVQGMAESLFNSAPLVMGEIIALASGGDPFDGTPIDPAAPDGATRWQATLTAACELSFPVQLDALQKVGNLTFTTEMPPKKFLSALVQMVQSANASTLTPSSGD